MNITILKEDNDETRVATTPEIAKSLISLGFEIFIESKAGELATISDDKFAAAGAKIVYDRDTLLANGDIFFFINSPSEEDIKKMKKGSIVIGYLNALTDKEYLTKLAKQSITGYSLELMPRISRAQSMDILSSQNNISGYRSIIEASHAYGGLFPMMMTAAGSISPARVFVIGVGVAGLQAIATAKRLGAIVTAYDVRAATKEQVESLGGKFLIVDEESSKSAETSTGYAKEMDDSYKTKERNMLLAHLKTQNIVITTALIPAKKAPILIDDEMLDIMANQGAVIVDLAAESGGNTTKTVLGEINNYKGIKIVGYGNLAKKSPFDSSKMFAKNIFNFIVPHIKDGMLNMNIDDETVAKTLVTNNSIVVID